jgi:hypothetical protein
MRGVQISRSESVQSQVQEVSASAVSVLCYEAQGKWHLGETASSQTTVAEAISLAKSMNDMPGLALALWHAAGFAYYEGNPAEVERLASDLIELYTSKFCALAASRRGSPRLGAQHFRWRRARHLVDRGRNWGLSGNRRAPVCAIFSGAKGWSFAPCRSHLEALEAIREAEGLVERFEERLWRVDVHRLRGVFLAAMGADETQIEASFCEAIRIAREQKSISLEKRAEGTYAEYRRQKASL